LRCFCP